MAESIRVGVVGVGNMGRHHVRNYHELDNVDLVGVADDSPEANAVAEEYGIPMYADLEDLVHLEGVEAATVAVPTPYHYEIAKRLLESGVHTLVEKPITQSVEEAEDLINVAQRAKRILTVGHIERFNPVVSAIREIVVAERLGELSSIICKRLGILPPKEPQTDVISDLAIHDIDIMQYLLGSPLNLLSAHGSRTFHTREIDSAELLLSANGTSGFAQANWVTPTKIRTISLTGEQGYLEANYITQKLILYPHQTSGSTDNFEEFVDRYGEPERIEQEVKTQEPLHLELKAFVGAIATNDTTEIVNPLEAKDALSLALEAKEQVSKDMDKQHE